ncbi:hypothetical protein [Mesorhizobium sp. M0586]|uniref:hypothetical protein n=1 Tax=unclassified Mesorhizobium TaxID=325217 RepID=UPI00333DF508
MNSKSTKAKRKAIQGLSLAELVAAGRLPPFFHLRDVFDRSADQNHTSQGVQLGQGLHNDQSQTDPMSDNPKKD